MRTDPDSDPDLRRIYIERDNNGLFQKWVLGIAGVLVIGAIGNGVIMFGKLSAIEARLNYLEMQCYRMK